MFPSLFPDREALSRLCTRNHIRKLSLFGSTQKGAQRPDSDVDLLVEFQPGQEPGLIGLARIEAELSTLLGGRKVDLRTASDLSRYFREEIQRTALCNMPPDDAIRRRLSAVPAPNQRIAS